MSHAALAWRSTFTLALGRAGRALARLRSASGGTALPGLLMEKTDPNFLARTLAQLPQGVVVVSGTNGKTTTTKMLVQLLRAQGLKVFTNPTGSNFIRGVLASLLTQVNWQGRLAADIAVLELDEAHAVHFVNRVAPRHCLLLNVMRDQLDRFGEIDYTAALLHKIATATTTTVVLNADDRRLNTEEFLDAVQANIVRFGVSPQLRHLFLTDDELHATPRPAAAEDSPLTAPTARVILRSISGQKSSLTIDGNAYTLHMHMPGLHNHLNACAALTLALEILPDSTPIAPLLHCLTQVEAAFGRGEIITLTGCEIELILVKNPAGFRMGLLSSAPPAPENRSTATMMVINDQYADGRDMSWLWDVDFSILRTAGVQLVSGSRAWDMALRLRYDEVSVKTIEPDLVKATENLRDLATKNSHIRIFATYTAMLELRKLLGKITEVKQVA